MRKAPCPVRRLYAAKCSNWVWTETVETAIWLTLFLFAPLGRATLSYTDTNRWKTVHNVRVSPQHLRTISLRDGTEGPSKRGDLEKKLVAKQMDPLRIQPAASPTWFWPAETWNFGQTCFIAEFIRTGVQLIKDFSPAIPPHISPMPQFWAPRFPQCFFGATEMVDISAEEAQRCLAPDDSGAKSCS